MVLLKPVIGTAAAYSSKEQKISLSRAYVRSIEAAGGLPLAVPVVSSPQDATEALLAHLDGLLLTGGGDLAPHCYGESPRPNLGRVEPERDALELALVRGARDRGLPLLAICRGIQVLNVALGGDLYQDIPSQLPRALQHSQQAPRWHASHAVQLDRHTGLAAIMDRRQHLRVNSFHHQAVRTAAPGLQIVARAPDGVVESVEAADHPFMLGVQWHPEHMWQRQPLFLNLFRALVDAAASGA